MMLDRRAWLKGSGALVVAFAMKAEAANLPRGPYGVPDDEIDSWLSVDADGITTLYSGCCELGTGSSTGLMQVLAEELDVPFASVRLHGPDTDRTPDQYVSSGSRTIAWHSVPIRQAAAEARAALVSLAAAKLGVAPAEIVTRDGIAFVRADESHRVSYAALVGGRDFNLKVTGKIPTKPVAEYRIVGTSVPRIDIPGKVTGACTYMQDVKVPGMLHARMIRPPSHGATVVSIDEASVAALKGLVKVVRQADLVGVICEREEQAIAAANALHITWSDWSGLPPMADLYDRLRNLPEFPAGYPKNAPGGVLSIKGDVPTALAGAAKIVTATYLAPYHHHGSIGPSCAIADVRADGVTIWSATQTPFGLREAAAKFLGLPNDKVRLIYAEGSGCYGQNGADDVVVDALVLSRAVGRPVRVQWTRAQENGWEAMRGGRVSEARAGLDEHGNIVAWQAQTYGLSGYSRPEYHEPKHGGEPGSLVTAQLAGWEKPGLEEGFSGAAGNFLPVYSIENQHVGFTYFGPDSHRNGPLRLRVGSMRGVGSPDNIFVCETFMDELAAAAGADPVEYRRRHLKSPRHEAVLQAAADKFGWAPRPAAAALGTTDVVRGRGVSLLGTDGRRHDTIVCGMLEVEVTKSTGAVRLIRAVIAQDCGLIVNPDAIRNQMEGGTIQATSRALMEEVTFDDRAITSIDWLTYPIIRFPMVPETIETVLINRPDLPPMRVGEPASESIWPALSNAIFDAIGKRLRQMPFTPERVKA